MAALNSNRRGQDVVFMVPGDYLDGAVEITIPEPTNKRDVHTHQQYYAWLRKQANVEDWNRNHYGSDYNE